MKAGGIHIFEAKAGPSMLAAAEANASAPCESKKFVRTRYIEQKQGYNVLESRPHRAEQPLILLPIPRKVFFPPHL